MCISNYFSCTVTLKPIHVFSSLFENAFKSLSYFKTFGSVVNLKCTTKTKFGSLKTPITKPSSYLKNV